MNSSMKLLAIAVGAMAASSAWAQADAAHAGHQGQTAQSQAASKPAASQPAGAMDHGDMKMQGGDAPEDARDPHAYSGGYSIGAGTYAVSDSRLLRLADEHYFGGLMLDRLESVWVSGNRSTAYDLQAWYGRDYGRLVLKAEGDIAGGELHEARTELLLSRAIDTFWDAQAGIRYDSGAGQDRRWLALGVQGLAPYWFEVDAAAYLGENGMMALRMEAEYELLITQRLILQPRVEATLNSKRDEAMEAGRGLSEAAAGIRLRYEFSRQFAPYVGVEWAGKLGETADMARAAGDKTQEVRWVAGLRFWF